jgi:hypothetical protein
MHAHCLHGGGGAYSFSCGNSSGSAAASPSLAPAAAIDLLLGLLPLACAA